MTNNKPAQYRSWNSQAEQRLFTTSLPECGTFGETVPVVIRAVSFLWNQRDRTAGGSRKAYETAGSWRDRAGRLHIAGTQGMSIVAAVYLSLI
jgi:hypothetical protein